MKIPFPGDQEEIKGVDGKIRYEKGPVDGLDWAPDNDETEISGSAEDPGEVGGPLERAGDRRSKKRR